MPLSQKMAHFLAALFHPLLFPTLSFTILFYATPTLVGNLKHEAKLNLLFVIFLMTFLMPMLSIILLYFLGKVSSFLMHERSERHLPFVITTLLYAGCAYFFYSRLQALPIIYIILACTTVALFLVTIINFFWKISAHSVGVSGVLGFILALNYYAPTTILLYIFIFCTIIAGLLMSARLYVEAHSPAQVWLGALLGLVVCGLGTILLL